LGFPTANLEGIRTVLPAHGVYGGAAYVGLQSSGFRLQDPDKTAGRNLPKPEARSPNSLHQRWPAAINVGPNPTFDEMDTKVEIHLVGFQGALYGETIEVEFLDRLRDVRKFAGIEELKTQLGRDIAAAAKTFECAAANRKGG
jgi:riboflavin kinase/FMN adenylyltransferase